MKANLLQDVLMRPALYQTLSGLRETSFRMSQAQSYLGDDPDVRVVGAFVAWNSGGTRAHQYVAAVLCGDALSRYSKNENFVLRPLAIEYLKDYLLNPIPDDLTRVLLPTSTQNFQGGITIAVGQSKPSKVRSEYPTIDELYLILKNSDDSSDKGTISDRRMAEVGGPMSHVIKFDQIMRALYRKEIPAYLKMVEADRQYNNPAFTEKSPIVTKRQNAAREIASAWQSFDQALMTDTDLADSVATIRSITMNDSFLTKADLFTNYSTDERNNKVAYAQADHTAFLTSYLSTHIGDDPQGKLKLYLTVQRAQFSQANEKDLSDFNATMVEVDKMANGQPADTDFTRAKAAAVLAAKIGLFTCGSSNCQDDTIRSIQFASTIRDTYTNDHPDAVENAKF